MKTISLKLDDGIFQETEQLVDKLQLARNRYINEAVAYYNRVQHRKLIDEQLAYEVNLVSEDSAIVLKEFEPLLGETLKDFPYETEY